MSEVNDDENSWKNFTRHSNCLQQQGGMEASSKKDDWNWDKIAIKSHSFNGVRLRVENDFFQCSAVASPFTQSLLNSLPILLIERYYKNL